MEKVLKDIAHRVVTTNLNELAYKQEYSVQMRCKNRMDKPKHTSITAWRFNANQVVTTEITRRPGVFGCCIFYCLGK